MKTVFNPPLPYTLRRPFFTFFRRYSVALLPLASILGLIGGEVLFLTALVFGVFTWLGLGICVVLSLESITIYDDRLILKHFRREYSAQFTDLAWVDVTLTSYSKAGQYHHLWVAWKGSEDRPLRMNFGVFAKRDRKLLLRTIATRASQVPLSDETNELAEAAR